MSIDKLKSETYRHLMKCRGQSISVELADYVYDLMDNAYREGRTVELEESLRGFKGVSKSIDETKKYFKEQLNAIDASDSEKEIEYMLMDLRDNLSKWCDK